jgi:hypothetical protein
MHLADYFFIYFGYGKIRKPLARFANLLAQVALPASQGILNYEQRYRFI